MITGIILAMALQQAPLTDVERIAEAAYLAGRCAVWDNREDEGAKQWHDISPAVGAMFEKGRADNDKEPLKADVCRAVMADVTAELRATTRYQRANR